MRQGAALSAVLSATIGLVGALTFLFTERPGVNMPPGSWGFLYLPALAGLVAGGLIGTPIGVKLTGIWSQRQLHMAYIVFLCLVFVVMISKMI